MILSRALSGLSPVRWRIFIIAMLETSGDETAASVPEPRALVYHEASSPMPIFLPLAERRQGEPLPRCRERAAGAEERYRCPSSRNSSSGCVRAKEGRNRKQH